MPAWVPLGMLFVALFVGVSKLERDARRLGVAEIDTTRYRLQLGSQWLSPAWRAELEELLIASRRLSVDDPEGIEEFVGRVGRLPFVAEVGEPEVQWPDSLSFPLRLYEPIACVPAGVREFLPVAENGVVLGGYAFSPHDAYGGWLPVIGPHGALADDLEPGDVVDGEVAARGLSVAESMWRFLDVGDLRRLGRVVVDASADEAPVFDRAPGSATPEALPGGVVLALEDGRRVFFGRPPEPVFVGELPVGRKWRHLADALADSEAGDDWRLLDVRFDTPVRLDRAQVESFAERGVIEPRDVPGRSDIPR